VKGVAVRHCDKGKPAGRQEIKAVTRKPFGIEHVLKQVAAE
jgi:hypothetical protein